jgi:uncharacterized membrane protein
MPNSTLAGHPLHPQLIGAPTALLPFSLVMDVMHAVTGNDSYAETAYQSMVGGVVGGLAAAAAGATDYFEISSGSHTKRIANLHAALNIGLLSLYGVNLLLRRGQKPPAGRLPLALSVIGAAGLTASAWYGGHLVYEHGMRVKGVSPVGSEPEAKLPHDEAAERAFAKPESLAPKGGPET